MDARPEDQRFENARDAISKLDGVTSVEVTVASQAVAPVFIVHTSDLSDPGVTMRNSQTIADSILSKTPASVIVIDRATAPQMVAIGPWRVSANSRWPLVTAGATLLVMIAALAGVVAWRHRDHQ
jgi:copper chaperone CopZ